MRKPSKADQEKLRKLYPAASRYERHSQQAKVWHENTGSAMFEPGGLTESLKRSKAAKAEIQGILRKYR